MMHGMGAGSGFWALNIDSLAAGQKRPIVTVDLPGFARSSRQGELEVKGYGNFMFARNKFYSFNFVPKPVSPSF